MFTKQREEQLINFCVRQVLDSAHASRETAFAEVRVMCYSDAIASGLDHASATRWTAKVEESTRRLVNQIDTSGGTSGGNG